MKLNIAGHEFDSEELREVSIRESQRQVFVTTQDDFFRINYSSKEDIEDAYFWKNMSDITFKDIHNAMYVLTMVCDYFINTKEQCQKCPLRKNTICILSTIPNNWR